MIFYLQSEKEDMEIHAYKLGEKYGEKVLGCDFKNEKFVRNVQDQIAKYIENELDRQKKEGDQGSPLKPLRLSFVAHSGRENDEVIFFSFTEKEFTEAVSNLIPKKYHNYPIIFDLLGCEVGARIEYKGEIRNPFASAVVDQLASKLKRLEVRAFSNLLASDAKNQVFGARLRYKIDESGVASYEFRLFDNRHAEKINKFLHQQKKNMIFRQISLSNIINKCPDNEIAREIKKIKDHANQRIVIDNEMDQHLKKIRSFNNPRVELDRDLSHQFSAEKTSPSFTQV